MGRHWKRQNPSSWVVELKKAHKTYVREEFDHFHSAHHRAHTLRCLYSLDPQVLMIHQDLRMIRVDATSYFPKRNELSYAHNAAGSSSKVHVRRG